MVEGSTLGPVWEVVLVEVLVAEEALVVDMEVASVQGLVREVVLEEDLAVDMEVVREAAAFSKVVVFEGQALYA
jgi:hypothetical protein